MQASICCSGDPIKVNMFESADGHRVLLDIAKTHQHNTDVLAICCEGFTAAAKSNRRIAIFIARQFGENVTSVIIMSLSAVV